MLPSALCSGSSSRPQLAQRGLEEKFLGGGDMSTPLSYCFKEACWKKKICFFVLFLNYACIHCVRWSLVVFVFTSQKDSRKNIQLIPRW